MTIWAEYGSVFIPEAQEGWSWPLRLTRAHYFHRGQSLCGEVEHFEHGGEPDRIDRHPWDRCRRCDTRAAKLEQYRRGSRPTLKEFA